MDEFEWRKRAREVEERQATLVAVGRPVSRDPKTRPKIKREARRRRFDDIRFILNYSVGYLTERPEHIRI